MSWLGFEPGAPTFVAILPINFEPGAPTFVAILPINYEGFKKARVHQK